ncbi:hypothetical protein Q4303_15550 [Acinetobacter baumannii]
MKPEHFIREFGVDKARQVVEGAPEGYKGYNDTTGLYTLVIWFERDVLILDLKNLVDSIDLIKSCGGIENVKDENPIWDWPDEIEARLPQAIRDHESIYGGGDE